MDSSVWLILWAVGGFVVGSFPPALVVGKLFGVDVLKDGSRNPGTSNVNALAGKWAAALTFLVDAAIGFGSALIPLWVGLGTPGAAVASAAVVGGRAFSPLLAFRGGRAQVLVLAGSIVVVPYAGLILLGTFAVGAAVRSLALFDFVGLATLWIWAWILYGGTAAIGYAVVVAVITVVRRLMGSPDDRPFSYVQRCVFDRERIPPVAAPRSESDQ